MLRPGRLANSLVSLPAVLWSGAMVVLGLTAASPRRPEWLASMIELSDRRWLALGLAMVAVGLFCFLTTVADRWFRALRAHVAIWTAEMCLLCVAFLGLLAAVAR